MMMQQLLTSCRYGASWPAPSLTASSPSHPPAATIRDASSTAHIIISTLHHIYIDSSHAVLEHCLSQALLYSHLGCTSLRRRDDIKYNTLAVQPTTLFHMPSKAGCASPARPFRQDLSLHWHSLPSHPGKLPVTWSRCACSTIDNIARRLEFALRAGAKSQS